MEIEKDNRDKIVSYYNYLKEHNDIEFEMIVKQGKINNYDFMAVLQYMRSVKLPFLFHPETLSINFKYKNIPYRFEIVGKKDISTYCTTNNIANISKPILISKSWVQGKYPITIEDYGLKITMKEEHPVEHDENAEIIREIKKHLYSLKKVYRLKKRFSFNSEDGLFRYDLTIVKSSKKEEGSANLQPSLNLISSGIFQSEDQYEIEVEFLRPDDKIWPSDEKFFQSLLNHQALLLQVLNEDNHIISETTKKKVIQNYRKLTNIQSKDTQYFIGPKPITLEVKNLLMPELGISSILQDYSVTDKADGERHLLFIDSDGKTYLINDRLFVRYTGLTNEKMKNSILDGEYVTRSKSNRPMHLFMAFDIFYHQGENVSNLPLMMEKNEDSRIVRMTDVTSSRFSGDSKIVIQSKQFLAGDIFKSSDDILQKSKKGNLPYKIDGLIYTPKFIPVGGLYKDSSPVLGGTWVKVFKWKPPEDNSIDFLVKTEKNTSGSDMVQEIDGRYTKILNLYVGYDILKSQKVTPYDYLSGTVNLDEGYINTPFEPPEEIYQNISLTHVELDENNTMRTLSGEIIIDGKVVEFSYDSKTKKWIPLRLRRDKVRGNDFSAAVNIWRSINNPVTIDIISGREPLKIDASEAIDADMYYNRLESRDNSASKHMLDFHNYWVKNMNMVDKFKGKAKSVFDIACGKGSDRDKYWKAGFRTIVGVDKSEDNIVNPKDGAYARLLQQIKKGYVTLKPEDKIVFLPIDCSKVIDANYINSIKDEQTRNVIKLVWGHESITGLEKYHGIVSNKFDVVACQFAIHYFFENRVILDAFITNVASVLKDGGYFIGTCLDGAIVDQAMKQAKTAFGQSISGTINDRVLWDIRRSYEKFDNDDRNKNYGLRIDVYMETINKRFSEYLVDFNLLEMELAKKGIRPLTADECKELNITAYSGSFEKLFSLMLKSDLRSYHIKQATEMTDEEKKYSFMNRYFIFKKDDSMMRASENLPVKPAPKKRGRPKKTT